MIPFVDLSKAFDFAIREILLSWRQGFDGDKRTHLMSLGLSEKEADDLISELVSDGGLLEWLGCDAGVCELINSLHTNSWLKYSDLDTVIVSNRGGRQGCKLGGHIFILIYSKALLSLRRRLLAKGIVLRLGKEDQKPFWVSSAKAVDQETPGDDVVEATFVDDECLMLCAKSPKRLDEAASFMFDQLVYMFSKFGFVINWSKGKTEIMCKYRGTHAARHMHEKCESGSPMFPLPAGASAKHVCIVDAYKYLGSIVCENGSYFNDAIHRASVAMNAFAPIAVRIFGNSSVSIKIKFMFFDSLICSRLLYNTELYVIDGSSSSLLVLRKLNSVYMRVLRRIAGEMRYGQKPCMRDIEVRIAFGIPSIDCRLRKMRLRYLSRMLAKGPAALVTLLSCSGPSRLERMPWSKQVINDLRALRVHFPSQLQELPDPQYDAAPWQKLMLDYPTQWAEIVQKYNVCDSVLDDAVRRGDVDDSNMYVCNLCTSSLSADCPNVRRVKSAKALAQHQRIYHNVRSPIPYYIDDSGVCPACGVNFFSRCKVVVHACETRVRSKACNIRCRDVILSGVLPKIEPLLFIKLEERDRSLKRDARRGGKSHVVINRLAKRSSTSISNRQKSIGFRRPDLYSNAGGGADDTVSLPPPERCLGLILFRLKESL